MSKDSLQLVSMSVNPCQGVCEVEHDCVTLIIAAEISLKLVEAAPSALSQEGFFLWVKYKPVIVFS